jgi:hypothetical protein
MTATADLSERRSLFDDDHEEFRASLREFLTRRVAGHVDAWERSRGTSLARSGWLRADRASSDSTSPKSTPEAAPRTTASAWR